MGRLENIVARNRQPSRLNERLIVSTLIGVIVLLIIALAVFTDLGAPPEARDARDTREAPAIPSAPAAPAAPGRGKRVDGILLRTPAKPAQH
jgi:hypothetical protein